MPNMRVILSVPIMVISTIVNLRLRVMFFKLLETLSTVTGLVS